MKIRVWIKDIAYTVLKYFPAGGTTVLTYHSVSDNAEFFTVKTESFRRQMEYLEKNGFRVLSLQELKEGIKNGSLPKRSVVITFDDGYEDNYTNAFPILKQYNFPATIFVSTSFIGQRTTGAKGSTLPFLTAEMIKKMDESGLITIGSHAKSHCKLTKLPVQKIELELLESKREIEAITHKDADAFAYPFGKYDGHIQKAASEIYDILCTVMTGKVNVNTKILEIPRNSIDSQVTDSQFSGIVNFGRIR